MVGQACGMLLEGRGRRLRWPLHVRQRGVGVMLPPQTDEVHGNPLSPLPLSGGNNGIHNVALDCRKD